MKAEVDFRCRHCRQIVDVYTNEKAKPHEDNDGRPCSGFAVKAIAEIKSVGDADNDAPIGLFARELMEKVEDDGGYEEMEIFVNVAELRRLCEWVVEKEAKG